MESKLGHRIARRAVHRLARRAVAMAALATAMIVLNGCHTPAGAREHALCCDCPPLCDVPPEPTPAPQHPNEVFEHHYGAEGKNLALVRHRLVMPEAMQTPVGFAAQNYALRAPARAPKPDFYAGGGLSLLPNIGASLHAGYVFSRTRDVEWAAELEGIWQFLDDESFADDGNPAAGDWYQIKAGVLARSAPQARRHLTGRGGFTWFQANGVPNIVEKPGNYYGIYAGVGFETDLTPNLTVGPELTLLVAKGPGALRDGVVPQLGWRITWRPGCGYQQARCPLPVGELYVGAFALVSPAFGGGGEFGQVFRRDGMATWSIEMSAAAQPLSNTLWSEGDGDWAQLRGGVKATFSPRRRGHVTGRLGLAWFRSTAPTTFFETPGDYYAAYLGVGYEYDLTRRFSTGPEIALLIASQEKDFDIQVAPQFLWHFIVKL